MLIRYTCRDMGLKCFFVVKDSSMEEVIKQALAHIQDKHTDEFNTLNSPVDIEKMKQSLMRSTRVVPD